MNSLFSIDAEELDYFDEDDNYLTNISIATNVTTQNKTNKKLRDSLNVSEQIKTGSKSEEPSENASVSLQKRFDKKPLQDINGNITLSSSNIPDITKEKVENSFDVTVMAKSRRVISGSLPQDSIGLEEYDWDIDWGNLNTSTEVPLKEASRKDGKRMKESRNLSVNHESNENSFSSREEGNSYKENSRFNMNIFSVRNEKHENSYSKKPSKVPSLDCSDDSKIESHLNLKDVNMISNDNSNKILYSSGKKRKSLSFPVSNARSLTERKLPGPAGVLPLLESPDEIPHAIHTPVRNKKQHRTSITPKMSKETVNILLETDDDFTKPLWNDLEQKFMEVFPYTNSSSISYILKNASLNRLPNGKAEFLYGLIKLFRITGSNGRLILKDPTGQINGTLHRNVLERYKAILKEGSGLILKDVSVFSPNLKKHYINITPSNIVHVIANDVDDMRGSQMSQAY